MQKIVDPSCKYENIIQVQATFITLFMCFNWCPSKDQDWITRFMWQERLSLIACGAPQATKNQKRDQSIYEKPSRRTNISVQNNYEQKAIYMRVKILLQEDYSCHNKVGTKCEERLKSLILKMVHEDIEF